MGSDRAAAEQAYATGVRAFDAGKLPEAVTALSTALMSGGLPNPQMARALYLRGQAYRKQGQAALAYTDLTSALWLKNGLAEPDKSKATSEREAAFREAGLGTQVPPVPGGESKPKVADAAAQPAQGAPKPGVNVASAPTSSSFLDNLNPLNLLSSGSSSQPPAAAAPSAAPAVAAAAPVQPAPVAAEPAVSSWATTSAPTPAAAAPPAAGYVDAAPQTQVASSASPDPLTQASNAVTGFFGSVLGSSGAPATAQPSTPMTTASTGGSPVAAGTAPAQGPQPAANAVPWTDPDATTTAAGPAEPRPQKKPAAAKVAAVAGPQSQAIKPAASGKFRLQVATVNTREEADKIAATVAQNPLLSGAQPEVDSVVYGNMGTFFRVRTGPYAKADEPKELCKQLRPQGYDCLVVTQ